MNHPADPKSQVGYWSLEVNPQVQLIGLDSIVDEDWNGLIDSRQMLWLEAELAAQADKFIILAVHHPLHKLAPIDDHPKYRNFICDNGPEVLALLDRYPQVKLVLTGHHHLTKADRLGERLHLACPAVGLYPCAYRTLRLTRQSNGSWRVAWHTLPAVDKNAVAEACHRMSTTWLEAGFEPGFIDEHIQLAFGDEYDRNGSILTK
jgi:3',5'-cyclic AMP phosphodiesterase CpdA